MEVDRVIAMAPQRVGLDEVGEDQAGLDLAQQPLGGVDAVHVRLRRERLVDVLRGEDVADLADAVDLVTRVADEAEEVGAAGHKREVVAVGGALVGAALAGERPGDDAADGVLADEQLAGDAAGLVQLLERHDVLVRCDLEDGVGRGVDDPLARLAVLVAVALDDLGARRRLVTEHAAARAVHERIDHIVGEAVRVGREGDRVDDPHQFPVTRRRVLPLGACQQAAGNRRGARLGAAALEGFNVAEAQGLQHWQVETTDGTSDIAERVGALVTVLGSVWQGASADCIENDHTYAGHGAILTT